MREIDAHAAESPLRRGDVHDAEFARRLQSRQDSRDVQHDGARPGDHAKVVARVELEPRRGAAGESQSASESRSEDASSAPVFARIDDERRLHANGTQGIDPHDAKRFIAAGERCLDLQHGARHLHARQSRDRGEDRIVEAVARPTDLEVGLARERMGGAIDFRERRGVDRVHGAGECDARARCRRL